MNWIVDAFFELSTERQITMGGAGPIPRSAVTDYMRSEGITNDQTFRSLIRSLDAVYLRTMREKSDG